jgi:voltage-gated potassium channel
MQNLFTLVFRRMRLPLVALISVYAISVLVMTLIPGLDDQGNPWKMSFFHAFYFVSFMGSTIGFGEIPYAFSDAQRLWTTVTIYASVIAWLYAIGTMLSLVQSQLFRRALSEQRFRRRIRRLKDPFYIICGFGDTGQSLVKTMLQNNQRAVVIDNEPERIEMIDAQDWDYSLPGLVGNADDSNNLTKAGIHSDNCKGVIALTQNDNTNLLIALSAKILEPNMKVICRAQTLDAQRNMESFGTDLVVNPYETFAEDFVLAMEKPSMYLLERWITAPADTPLIEPVFPPKGHWILCGFGRFGKAMYQRLLETGNPVTVVEAKPNWTNPPKNTIIGRGTEAITLEAAKIKHAVGIIAGTNNDVNNLSILLTAEELNPKIFTILRQELAVNQHLSQAMKPDMLMDHTQIITSRVMENLTTPLTGHFLRQARTEPEQWASVLVSRIIALLDDEVPTTWVLSIRKDKTPAVWDQLRNNQDVLLGDLMRSPTNHLVNLLCIPLLLQRRRKLHLLPDEGMPLKFGDRILFCGRERARNRMNLICSTQQKLHFSQTGEVRSDGWLWNLIFNRKQEKHPSMLDRVHIHATNNSMMKKKKKKKTAKTKIN